MSEENKGATRRDFLKIATTAAPAAALVMATGEQAEAATPNLASQKMQDTAHVRAYYDSARF